MSQINFAGIQSYEDFRSLATDESLSKYERIGFPDTFRKGREAAIFADILIKLPLLQQTGKTILDIGPGCSDLPQMLHQHCTKQQHHLILNDSAEMLAQLPAWADVTPIAGRFPETVPAVKAASAHGMVDMILCYSVFHYIFVDTDHFAFLDQSIALLADGGQMLIGDIPNLDKRNRFFASPNGIAFHKQYMNTDQPPVITRNSPEMNAIDDAVLDRIVQHARAAGCDAYILPQPDDLPMANRRDDLVIRKP